MMDFLNAWLHDWGWLWMLIGLLGNLVIVVAFSD